MDPLTAATVLCLLIAAAFLSLWIFYDRRDHALFEHARRKSTFCCARCTHIYGAAGRPDVCRCPQCGHENARLRF